MQFLEGRNAVGHDARGHRNARLLPVDVDAEALPAVEFVGEIDRSVGDNFAAFLGAEKVKYPGLELFGRHRLALDDAKGAADPHSGALPGFQMNVRRPQPDGGAKKGIGLGRSPMRANYIKCSRGLLGGDIAEIGRLIFAAVIIHKSSST